MFYEFKSGKFIETVFGYVCSPRIAIIGRGTVELVGLENPILL